jgi:hypothetical protein
MRFSDVFWRARIGSFVHHVSATKSSSDTGQQSLASTTDEPTSEFWIDFVTQQIDDRRARIWSIKR